MGLEYDGSSFRGWQKQRDVSSIQDTLEKALSRVAANPILTVAAGRTDAGVHATQQVIHFDSPIFRRDHSWVYGTNTFLPASVRVLWAKQIPDTFNARKSALSRTYRYLIYNHTIRPSLFRSQAGWYYKKLDVHRMRKASEYWLGEHDFTSFRASECQSKSPFRRIIRISIHQPSEHWISIEIEANAFLYHMVRNMIGVLWKIGSNEAQPEWAAEVLKAKSRQKAGVTVTAAGLYLISVKYPSEFEIPHYFGTEHLI